MPLSNDYKKTVHEVYAAAALEPDAGLCCIERAAWSFPDLTIPEVMLQMNYGCGSTVHPADLTGSRPILYVGVGGGLEALQFAYFRRKKGGVIAVDPVPEMRQAAARNLEEAARKNSWFRADFVQIVDGAADALPVADSSVDVVAQNCLFNVFTDDDLSAALAEVYRVLAPGGRFSTSDPITTAPLPEALKRNSTLRARCCSGCQSYEAYLSRIQEAGFQQILVRARVPYRLLTPDELPEVEKPILLESVEVLGLKSDRPGAAAEVYSGRYAIYKGKGAFSYRSIFTFSAGTPVPVSDRIALELLQRPDFLVTEPTYQARSPGCC